MTSAYSPWERLSPLAKRLHSLLTGSAKDARFWPHSAQISVGLGVQSDGRYTIDGQMRQRVAEPARELIEHELRDEHRSAAPYYMVVLAGLAGADAETGERLAKERGPIAMAEFRVVSSWEVEQRALYVEAVKEDHLRETPPVEAVLSWLETQPGYTGFARTALDDALARVRAIQAGEIPYSTRAFDLWEIAVVGRAVRLALRRDETWLPELLDELVRGIAVAPTQAKTLPSQGLLYEIARATEDFPTPEAVDALRTARRITRNASVSKQLDKQFKRIDPALADRLEVAFRMPDGRVRQQLGEHTAVISIDGAVELSWWLRDKKLKSVPAAVRRDFPDEVKLLKERARQTVQQQATLVRALEAGYTSLTPPPYRQLAGNPVTDRLIWEFEVSPGVWQAQLGLTVPDVPVRLWHPARATVEEVRAWRETIHDKEIRQPFKQAFREVYLLTPAEEAAVTHSARFADHLCVYPRLRALFKDRGWKSNYLGFWDGGGGYDDPAHRTLAGGQWRVNLQHDLYEEGYVVTGAVEFKRLTAGRWVPAPLAEVPPLVFSEGMRDADLFVAVSSIMSDPQGGDREPGPLRDYWENHSFADLSSTAQVRRDALARLLPRLTIADRCTLSGRFLVVRGDLRTYKIHLGSANILMEPNDAYLCIVAKATASSGLFLPFEEDGRLSLILSKAFLLADDTAITDPTIVRQIEAA